MDLAISDEQKEIAQTVRKFVQEQIVTLELEMDPDATELPKDDKERLVKITQSMGLYNLELPEEYGGPGIDTVTRCLIAMEMSQHRAGLYAPCYQTFGHLGQIPLLSAFANEDQKERYLYPSISGEKRACFALSEAGGGSDPGRSIATRAVKDGNEWVINGSKTWISDAADADFALIFARTGGPGRDGITCFIADIDSPGFKVNRIVHTLRAAHPATELFFDDLRVPEENVLGGVGNGFKLASVRLAKSRIPYSAACLGVAIKAQKMAVEYARDRKAFGKRLIDHQGISWMLVDNENEIRMATFMVMLAADKADKGQPFRTEGSAAKMIATETAGRVVDRAIQIHGGMGVSKEMPLERWYRELRIRRIGEGATEVHRMVIGRDLEKNPYRSFLD